MSTCEELKCPFWNSKKEECDDPEEFYNEIDNELCCRYHFRAINVKTGDHGEQYDEYYGT